MGENLHPFNSASSYSKTEDTRTCLSTEFLESRWASIAGPSSWSHVTCHRSRSGRARGAPRQLFAASKLFVAEAAASSGEKSRQQHIFVKCSSFDLLARCNFRSATRSRNVRNLLVSLATLLYVTAAPLCLPSIIKGIINHLEMRCIFHIPCSTKLTRADGSLAGLGRASEHTTTTKSLVWRARKCWLKLI